MNGAPQKPMPRRKQTYDITRAILDEARSGDHNELKIVVAVLLPHRLVAVSEFEYGDGEGIRYVDDFIDDVRNGRYLNPGETIEREIVIVTSTNPPLNLSKHLRVV